MLRVAALALALGLLAGCSLGSLFGGGGGASSTAATASSASCAPGQFALAGQIPPPGEPLPPNTITAGAWGITDNSEDCGCVLNIGGGGRADARNCRHAGLNAVTRYGFATDTGGRELILMGAGSNAVLFRLRSDGPNRFSGLLNGRPVIMWLPAS